MSRSHAYLLTVHIHKYLNYKYTLSTTEKQLTFFSLNVTSNSVAYSSQTVLKVINPYIIGDSNVISSAYASGPVKCPPI